MYIGEKPLKHGNMSREEMVERIGPLLVLPYNSIGAEVGVQHGNHADLIMNVVNPKHVYLIDIWEDEAIYEVVKSRFGDRDNVDIWRMPSVEAAKRIEDESLDWAYIDADHSYESVRDEIAAYVPKLKPRGKMLFHDNVNWVGVPRAIMEACTADGPLFYINQGRDRMNTGMCAKFVLDFPIE